MERSIRDIIEDGNSTSATEKQKQEFSALFHQEDIEFEVKNQLLDDLIQTKNSFHNSSYFDSLFDKFWRRRKLEIPVPRQQNRVLFRILQVAAVLAIGLFLGYFLNSLSKNNAPVYYTSVAPKGSVSEMYLPDGTHIYLNSGSKIKYSVDGADGMREVFLTGEAWFQVAKMKEKPFLVHTPAYNVKVTGTRFDVKAYPEDKEVSTTLEDGCVHVISSENVILSKETILKPGEQLVFNKESRTIQVTEVNTKYYSSWKDNRLLFINMTLKDLKVLLERKYGVDIEMSDSGLLNYHYDGTLKNETILQVMEILKQTLPIDYRVVGQKIIIYKKK